MDALEASLAELMALTPLYADLGFRVVRAGAGDVTLSFAPGPAHRNVQGLVHGGLLATLADTAMGFAVRTQLPPGRPHVTVQLGISYLRPAPAEGSLMATARTTKIGRTLAFARAEILAEDGSVVATAEATISVAEPNT